MDELYPMEKWLNTLFDRLKNLEDIEDLKDIQEEIADEFGEEVAHIIDMSYSADRLHYHQKGGMGEYTGDFIEKFESIKTFVNDLFTRYSI
jgi:hypothetical protein